ncbi:signal peptidase I [Streptacidiphilus sp. ASG 303]|uniref:signal peptidase I n=1 Tax=Streptacidiphilus sp. ASG 303 TaxID=2896847 RepID=UPI001E3EB92E|nr:signal peptidase I [Streptacidiphilus sp. ASG 303]MCD0484966.1 signal peptidase I [Streptacidiphilus sp. ASG 303]
MGTRGRPRVADPPPGGGSAPDRTAAAAVGSGSGADGPGRDGRRRRSSGLSRAERRRIARRAARRRKRSFLRELPVVAGVALVIALLLKTFLLQVFVIPSGSMEDTIKIGDRVLVDKLTPWFGKEYRRGDVVVFRDPGNWLPPDERRASEDGPVVRGVKQAFTAVGLLPSDNEGDLIKRVIGVGGDTVACCDRSGRLTVNGTAVDEPYVAPGNPASRITFKVAVPHGRLWVMGDHRDLSADSRFHMTDFGNGTIPLSNVIGRAVVVAWPVPRFHRLPEPASLSALPPPPGSVIGAAGPLPAAVPDPGGRAGGSAQPDAARPDPGEPPLVMGVAGALPFAVRRWRRGATPPG